MQICIVTITSGGRECGVSYRQDQLMIVAAAPRRPLFGHYCPKAETDIFDEIPAIPLSHSMRRGHVLEVGPTRVRNGLMHGYHSTPW